MPSYARIEPLYKEEKLYGRLLGRVLQAKGLFALQQYEKVLVKDYPKEVLQKYADEVNQMAKETGGRKKYQEWVAILCRMKKIEGGEEKVRKITECWKREYGNRRAMMEELAKLQRWEKEGINK